MSAMDQSRTSCLSALPHGPESIRDHVLHYFGCIKIADRPAYFLPENPLWRYEHDVELTILRSSPDFTALSDEEMTVEARQRVQRKQRSVAIDIDARYTIIAKIRRSLQRDRDSNGSDFQNYDNVISGNDDNVISRVEEIGRLWRVDDEYLDGIQITKSWRSGKPPGQRFRERHTDSASRSDILVDPGWEKCREFIRSFREVAATGPQQDKEMLLDQDPYNLEDDVQISLIQYTEGHGGGNILESPSMAMQAYRSMIQDPLIPFEENLESDDLPFRGIFPNQSFSLKLILDGNLGLSGLVYDEWGKRRIRYFHLPYNNMNLVESMIGSYYSNNSPFPSDLRGSNVTSRSSRSRTEIELLLQPGLWREQHGGQQEFNRNRHLPSICERVSTKTHEVDDDPKNIVLFMPYLYFETYTATKNITQFTGNAHAGYRKWHEEKLLREKMSLMEARQHLLTPAYRIIHREDDATWMRPRVDSIGGLLLRAVSRRDDIRSRIRHPLGRYLMYAAKAYTVMSFYQNRKLVDKYLFPDASFQPRRTLHQSCSSQSLKPVFSKTRDADQILYNGTRTHWEFSHSLEPYGGLWSKTKRKLGIGEVKWAWAGHSSKTDEYGCDRCKKDIQRTPRLVMVDQLWMWILDEKTLITSFPHRYGSGLDSDVEGIHKSIRNRLDFARKHEVRSVYDLGLIVIDECSNGLFGGFSPEKNQPPVMQVFSESIGKVVSATATSLQHTLHWMNKEERNYKRNLKVANSSQLLEGPITGAATEAQLQLEAQKIIHELGLMINIQTEQRSLVERFSGHVEDILDSKARSNAPGAGTTGSSPTESEDSPLPKAEYQLSWFRQQAGILKRKLDGRINELENLKRMAEDAESKVRDLISLKQQHTSDRQTREAAVQGIRTLGQERAVMMFTVITIIFLPLSFMSSIFGMNNIDFGSADVMTLKEQLRLMFPISLLMVFVFLVVAFSGLVRYFIWLWSLFTYVVVWLVHKTRIYRLWPNFGGDYNDWGIAALKLSTETRLEIIEYEQRARRNRRERNKGRKKRQTDAIARIRKKKESEDSRMGKHMEEPRVVEVGAEGTEMSGALGGQGPVSNPGDSVV
ncbi:hypothetical protein QBC43DRAFT_318533 [Cladorrhinum sp. PSN259]|nr:hypothetical protein QBC43DRAFT_318533 [Cladorrhinum sp. PSN259]